MTTTIHRRILRGRPGARGWRALQACEGEPHRAAPGEGELLAALWHLTDPHICDAESPARLEYLDRFGDEDSPYATALGEIGTYRPHEILTVPLLIAMLQAIASVKSAPISGGGINALIIGGDTTDNAQGNEWEWFTAVLRGGGVTPASGDPLHSSWVGAGTGMDFDARYWHPDCGGDRPTLGYGYPTVPGLITAARSPMASPGARLPVITVSGNHDVLLQGTVPVTEPLARLAVGGERITGLPAGADPLMTAEAIPEYGPARYLHDLSSPRSAIASDPRRAIVAPLVAGDRRTRIGGVTIITLDTVNPHGGWNGSLTESQCHWLAETLAQTAEEYVVIVCHHPTISLTNDYAPMGAAPRVTGERLTTLIAEHPQVVALLTGHIHRHAARLHPRPGHPRGRGSRLPAGCWEIVTASLIDWPQQARILEFIREVHDGEPSLAIVSTVVDHAGGLTWQGDPLENPLTLASLARDLAANDYHDRARGTREPITGGQASGTERTSVRNTVWRLADPLA